MVRSRIRVVKNFAGIDQYLAVFESFVRYAAAQGVPRNNRDIAVSGHTIRVQLKAFIARQLFNFEGYYKVRQDIDPTFQRAVVLMEADTVARAAGK